jgi:hypothetical protein
MGFMLLLTCTATVLAVLFLFEWRRLHRQARLEQRRAYIATYRFPPSIRHRIQQEQPALDEAAIDRCLDGLRRFFMLHQPRVRPLGMPSRGVDLVWHAFLLDTRAYAEFCAKAFDTFLHHMPDAPDATLAANRESLRRCWAANCRAEGIDPSKPRMLPSLFTLDLALGLSGGFRVTAEELVWLTGESPARPPGRSAQAGGGGCTAAAACGSSGAGCSGGSGGCSGGCGSGGG